MDESSQLSVDYFKDLTNALENSPGSKVLFVGDNFQTEAIGQDAHVLDAERSPVPPTHRASLTGLLRQEAGSGLGLTVTRMRATHTPAVPTRSTEDFQLHDGLRSFEDAYKKALLENADDVAMIVATNADRLYWNKVARDTLFGAQASKALVAGDLLMSVANSVNVNNGEQLKVLSPGKAHAEFQVKMPSSDKKGVVMVNFIRYVGARVSLGRETFEPILYMAPGLTLPSVWQVEVEQGLDNESRAALEQLGDLKLNTATGRRSFDPRIIFATHGFAVTAHKAQGSEWGRVFVKQSYNSGWDMARWLYTAATRAKKRVDLLAQPDPRLQQRFDLEEYRAEMEQVPIEFIERPVTHSLTRVVEEYTPAELIDRTLYGMGRRAGDPSPAWAKKRLLEDYRDEFEAIVRAPTRDKAHKAIDKLVRDPRVQPPVDLYAEKVFRRWIDHKFEWTGDAWPAVDRQPGELRPTQKVLQDTPEEYVREIGEQPNYRRYKTADALVEEWLEAHIEEVVAQNPDMTGPTLLDKRIRLAEAWNKALAPFVKAPSYEVAAAALEDTNNLAGLTDLAVESMRQWAYEHLPSKFSKAQQAYFDFAGDYSPHSLDGLADPVTQAPSEATHSLVAVVSGFDDVLSPYRGGGGATLTRVLVDESVQIQKELSKVDRFYKQRVVEWGLTGYIDKYKEYTFRIGPDGKPSKYKLKGRALWGNWGAEKITEDEQKLNALIQLAAYMGLEYTTVDNDGKPKFDKVAGERLRVILPVGVEGDIHELYKLLPETVALRLHKEMQQKLGAAKKLAEKELAKAREENPSITEGAAKALYQRTLALALG
ncbi:MAG: ATP-binding domain-containing protein, partial [Candidatus Pacebacteria bacterium]|nr:ATP-binding domain-containing protein [Candidatus Paceibacterota bacterium]